jgi:hypothetical protein
MGYNRPETLDHHVEKNCLRILGQMGMGEFKQDIICPLYGKMFQKSRV